MNISMGRDLRDYVDEDGDGCTTETEPMKQYTNRVMEIFVDRCGDYELDPNRMWLHLTCHLGAPTIPRRATGLGRTGVHHYDTAF